MNTFQLECYIALSDTLNYARTAEHMNVSQPAITRQIQSLENELGVKLFKRSTRSVDLTDDGKSFLADAKKILDISQNALQRFEKKRDNDFIRFAIGVPNSVYIRLLTPIICKMHQEYTNLKPVIVQMPLSQLLPKLNDGTIDVAMGIKDGETKALNYAFRKICSTTLTCMMPPNHPLTKEEVITSKLLQRYPAIIYNPTDIPSATVSWQEITNYGGSSEDVTFCDSSEIAASLSAAGVGVATSPKHLVPSIPGIVTRDLSDSPQLSLGIYYKSGQFNDYSKSMFSYLKDALNPMWN